MELLEQCGAQLLTFRHETRTVECGMIPGEFWSLCPKLETLQTAMHWSEPPVGHPLQTLQLSYRHTLREIADIVLDNGSKGDVNRAEALASLPFLPADPASSGRNIRIKLAISWRRILFRSKIGPRIALFLVDICMSRGYDLQDRFGVTFQEHIVFLINLSRRNHTSRLRFQPISLVVLLD